MITSLAGLAGRVFVGAIALASEALMGLTFYTEFFLRKGMLFTEPNPYVAGCEFFAVVLGAFGMTILLRRTE